ncbi:MAG: adenylate/guanylate cyclase domain-containing protein [Verrucomicrobia bacterium]|nr:adenylate/guanylate cyclase domain-containing protein [Verrucomicrobiota bacterium]
MRGGLIRASYDFPFSLRSPSRPDEVAIVYLDEESHRDLNQPFNAPWDRSLHTRLVEVLRQQQAKAVAFDILFSDPNTNASAADRLFAEAVKKHGHVVLAANYLRSEPAEGMLQETIEIPFDDLQAASAGWGNVKMNLDPDFGVRTHFPALSDVSGYGEVPTLAQAAARIVGSPHAQRPPAPARVRWLNYYGPPGTIQHISYHKALLPEGVEPGFFRDKIVFVGAQQSADFSGKGKDEFATPYTRWGMGFAPGTEIHATACLNLLRGDWLVRLPMFVEAIALAILGAGFGFGFARWRPLYAALAAVGAAVLVAVSACLLVWWTRHWFAWVIVVVVQIPVALLCAWLNQSLRWYVERKLLVESLSLHLSPSRAKQLLRQPELLRPGARLQKVSVLFTDISNYSLISESTVLKDLEKMLNQYFEAALAAVHETEGTVIKLIGDAIFAVWNAPEEQTDHQIRACHTALRLREQLVLHDAQNENAPLRTRAGLHTGEALVGNFGSSKRFDYTVMGDAVNLASRLEGLNKHLGTLILTTREFQMGIEDNFVTRPVGVFRFKGIARGVQVFEMVGTPDCADATKSWRESFGDGLHKFRRREFEEAARAFEETLRLSPKDGPSQFYLKQIQRFHEKPPDENWTGEVSLEEK